jgi:hypothetical protein
MSNVRFTLLLIGLAALLSGCFSKDQNVSLHSMHYLDGKNTVSLFDFEEGKVTDQVKLSISPEFPYGTTSINPVEETTLTMIQNEGEGYNYYLQSNKSFKKIGKMNDPVFGGVYTKKHIYTIVYNEEKVLLKEMDPESFKAVNEWELKGDPEAIVADYETGTVYALSRTDHILLYTLEDQKITEKQLLDDSYEVNAQFIDEQLIVSISQLVRSNGKETDNKEEKRIVFYDTEREEFTDSYTTKHPPKYVVPMEGELIVISGTPNSNYLETINDQNKVTSSSELKTQEIFGLASYKDQNYLVARDGVYKVNNQQITLIDKNEIPDSVDLSIH